MPDSRKTLLSAATSAQLSEMHPWRHLEENQHRALSVNPALLGAASAPARARYMGGPLLAGATLVQKCKAVPRTKWRAGWPCRCLRALIRGKDAHKLDVVQFTVTVKIQLFENGLGLCWRQLQAERRDYCAKIREPQRVGALTPSAKDAAHIDASLKSQCAADCATADAGFGVGCDRRSRAGCDAMSKCRAQGRMLTRALCRRMRC